jgi:hypothetical protein
VTIAQPEVSAAKVPPLPTQIEQLTFAAALDRLGGGGVIVGNDPHMLVWLVTLSGRWEDGFPHPTPPPPTPMPTPVSYYQRRVVINAQTGVVMASQ